jgi:uncharacterized membrane protein YqjE
MAQQSTARDGTEAPLSSIIGNLVGNLQDLIRGEFRLARQEIKEEAQKAGIGAGLLAGAGVTALVGLIFIGLTLTYVLTRWVPDWGAALIVAALFLIIAFALFTVGKQRLQRVDPVPRQTIESLKEDTEWVKQQIGADKS